MTAASAAAAIMVLFPRGCGHHARFAGAAPAPMNVAHASSKARAQTEPSAPGKAQAPAAADKDKKRKRRGTTGAARNYASDGTPPEISFRLYGDVKNRLGEYGPRLRIALSGRDKDSGLRGLYWRRGPGESWRRYRGRLSPYGAARHRRGKMEFMARDRAGNRSRVLEFRFRIDDVPPNMPFIYTGRPNSKGGSLAPRKGILIPTLEPGARMHYRINRGPFRACAPGARIALPGEGKLHITFRISDEVGNARVKTHVIRSDRTPPRTTIQTN